MIYGCICCQFYKGVVDWVVICQVKDVVLILVIVNGDIIFGVKVCDVLVVSGVDGVMIGCGVQGWLWVLVQVVVELIGVLILFELIFVEFIEMVCVYYEVMLLFYGVDLGGCVLCKYLGWYMDYVNIDGFLC